jgi:hypothetical protein
MIMHSPTISTLSSNQRKELIADIAGDMTPFPHKEETLEVLDFFDNLIEDLKTAKITSIGELKKILKIRSEQLKKLMQSH